MAANSVYAITRCAYSTFGYLDLTVGRVVYEMSVGVWGC